MQDIKIVTTVKGALRELIHIIEDERGTGDIYLILKSGIQNTPDKSIIKLDKFSIHPSNKSVSGINLIKRTKTLFDDTVHTSEAQLTNAIKSKAGFSYLFNISFSKLEGDYYSLRQDSKSTIFNIGTFAPENETLFITVLVGSAYSEFAPVGSFCAISQFVIGDVRLILLHGKFEVPATELLFHKSKITFDTKGWTDEAIIKNFKEHLKSQSPDSLMLLAKDIVNSTMVEQLKVHFHRTHNEEEKDLIITRMEELERERRSSFLNI